ncbi:hypothetical protein TYRP_017480 [Tyrophagus putrescentiae]|nr:hypothetical protein TYRP_017480 [Tyrophagus putrescentiae]
MSSRYMSGQRLRKISRRRPTHIGSRLLTKVATFLSFTAAHLASTRSQFFSRRSLSSPGKVAKADTM